MQTRRQEKHAQTESGRTVHAQCRGSAAVEMLLSVPFLFLFAVAMLHATRIARGEIKTQIAARHVAWMEGRTRDFVHNKDLGTDSKLFPVQPLMRDSGTFNGTHFGDPKAPATKKVFHDEQHLVKMTIDAAKGAKAEGSGGSGPSGHSKIVNFFSSANKYFGRGVFGWMAGMQWVTRSEVAYNMAGDSVALGWVFTPKTATVSHHVVLYSGQEDKPSKPLGWLNFRDLLKSIVN